MASTTQHTGSTPDLQSAGRIVRLRVAGALADVDPEAAPRFSRSYTTSSDPASRMAEEDPGH